VLGVVLLDPGDDEHLVIAGQAEDDGQRDDRQEAGGLRWGTALAAECWPSRADGRAVRTADLAANHSQPKI